MIQRRLDLSDGKLPSYLAERLKERIRERLKWSADLAAADAEMDAPPRELTADEAASAERTRSRLLAIVDEYRSQGRTK